MATGEEMGNVKEVRMNVGYEGRDGQEEEKEEKEEEREREGGGWITLMRSQENVKDENEMEETG